MNSELNRDEITAEAILESLHDVISDIDSFMFDWQQRFNRCADQMKPSHKPDDQLRRQIKEFQAQQRQWESQRKAEQEQLEANANQLTDAWLRLEAEQRALLQAGTQVSPLPTATQTDRRTVQTQSLDQGNSRVEQCLHAVRAQPDLHEVARAANGRVAMPRDVISPDAAIRQFEILKNELSSARKQMVGRTN